MTARMTREQQRKRRQAVAKYAAKHGSIAAAQKFGVAEYSARVWCREFGLMPLKMKRKGSGVNKTMLNAIALLQDGRTPTKVASILGVSRQYVHQIQHACRKYGVKIPRRVVAWVEE